MRLLTKADIFAANDRKTEDVAVPEWGGGVRCRSLTCKEHREFAARIENEKDDAIIAANLVVVCAIDDKGEPIFTAADIPQLVEKSASAVKRVAQAAMKLNALNKDAAEDAEKKS